MLAANLSNDGVEHGAGHGNRNRMAGEPRHLRVDQ
jgi:hypothetical protein